MTDPATTFAASLRNLRHRRNLTQRDVSTRVGCSNTHIGNIETGKSTPTLAHADAIARLLSVTLVSMLDGTFATCEHAKLTRQTSGAYKCNDCGDVVIAAPPPVALFGAVPHAKEGEG